MAASYASRLDQIPSTKISVSLHSAGKLTSAHTRGNKNHEDRDASANSEVKTRSDFVVKYKFGQCGHHAVSRRAWKPSHPRSPPPTTHGIAADRDWLVQVREFRRSDDVRELGYYDDLRNRAAAPPERTQNDTKTSSV